MKHPTEEQWIGYLYGELTPAERSPLETHLRDCLVCQDQTSAWRDAMHQLDAWKLKAPARPAAFPAWGGAWKWAAAACLLITTAFAAGRLSTPALDPAAIQAQIAQPLKQSIERDLDRRLAASAQTALAAIRDDLGQDLARQLDEIATRAASDAVLASQKQLEQLTLTLAAIRDEDRKAVLAALQEMETRRLADLRSLRQELETVAVNTDQSFRLAQRQLVQLAAHTTSNP